MTVPVRLPDLSTAIGQADPFPILAAVRESGPVRRMTMRPGIPVWVVSRYADVLAAFSDPRLSNDPHQTREFAAVLEGDFFSRSMIGTDPPEHTRLRRLVSKAFTVRRIEALRPRVQQITDELLGVPQADRDRFRSWTDEILDQPVDLRRDRDRMLANRHRMHGYLTELIAAKRREPGDDLLSALIDATDEGDRLDEQDLMAMTFLLLIAGYVTTVNLIGNGTLALLRAPAELERLRADPSLVPGAVEEFLRFDGPVNPGVTRYAVDDLEIAGEHIARGDIVLLATAAADRDPDRFADPDRLDVAAPDRGHLGFGHGIHYCLGAPLARLEGQVAFAALLDRLPQLALAVPPEDLAWQGGGVLRGLRELPVVFRAA